jgi:hypothetical protein
MPAMAVIMISVVLGAPAAGAAVCVMARKF